MAAPDFRLAPLVCKSGEIVFSKDAPMLATLGSCVGVVVHDRAQGLYGINHYLLPDPSSSSRKTELGDLEFGSLAIPAIFRQLKEMGSQQKDLVTWIIGGASQLHINSEVGRLNVEVAERKLTDLDIPILNRHTGGHLGRRVEVNIQKNTISVWLLNGAKTRNEATAIFQLT